MHQPARGSLVNLRVGLKIAITHRSVAGEHRTICEYALSKAI